MRETRPQRKHKQGHVRHGSATQTTTPVLHHGMVPDRQTLLRFIADHPERSTKRDIAKAFGLKGAARIELKAALKELEAEGLIERKRKTLTRPGSLPSVVLADITTRDADGGLIARPAEWGDEGVDAPAIAIRQAGADRAGHGRKATMASPRAAGIGDRVLVRTFPSKSDTGPSYAGRILKIIDRRQNASLGVFRAMPGGGGRIEPIEKRGQELVVDPGHTGNARSNDLVEISVTHTGRSGLARAQVLNIIAPIESEKAISMIAIHAHGIPHVFPADVLDEADAAKRADLKGREDWRDLPLITIDPADAKDHDDAVMGQADPSPDNPGGVIITVAIADVSWYVRPGSALDREARKRGNSVYFPDRVVPMLPERISNDLCSLRENEPRAALALRMVFSKDGRKARHTFHRVMMKNAAKLSYQEAQAAIDGAPSEKAAPLLETVLRPLWEAYAVLRRGRTRRQPLELDMPERRILLAPDGTIERVIIPERLEAHRLIEEFMIQANVAAAETLEKARQTLIFRIHDQPSLAKQEALREQLATLDIALARGGNLRANHFNGILARVADKPYQNLVNEMVLRSQSQAAYSPANIGHFGLNLMRYAHFTSPIRRYADLIVHRALVSALGLGAGGLSPQQEAELDNIAAEISMHERRAMNAERETIDRLVAHHLAGRVGEHFDGRVSGVTRAGLFVVLPHYGADGFVPISTLGRDYYIHDEAHQALVGEKTGLGFRLGDSVDVRLRDVRPLAGALQFEMLSEGRKLPKATRSFHKTAKTRHGRASNRTRHGRRPA